MRAQAANDPSQKRRSSSEGLAPVRVRLLGGFGVWVGPRAVGEGAWHLRKAKSLIKLLSLAPAHALQREQIMDLLWPELGKRAATNNLRVSLHAARRALAPDSVAASRYLASKEERVTLCPEVELWVDVEAFEEAARSARRSREPSAYRAALELCGGELLPEDLYEEWAQERRGELRRLYLALLVELAGLYRERSDPDSAIETLRKVVAEEPTNEEVHVGLMRLYALSGQSGEALRQYERLSEVLLGELGTPPDASTRALREEIAAGRFPSAPTPPTGPQTEEPAGGNNHNLPAPRSGFIGRERELLEVKRTLAMTRLLTLIGTGGAGKTRLALEVGRDLVGVYPDGVWLIELAGLSEEKLVPKVVADALDVPEQPGRSLTDALVEHLHKKQMLLVLDNCEHLVDAAARLADTLLSSCPHLRVLATSREALDVEGEVLWGVPPLSVPDADWSPAAPGELTRYDAVRLFVERARLRLPAFELNSENAGSVAQICRRLEGIPLAIELAAARVGVLSLEQISERLEDSLKLLTGGGRTAVPRQRTLRGTLDWSHELLPENERVLFRRLSTFAGGWTLEAAEAVGAGGGIEESDVLEVLSKLVDKSLVVAEARAADVVVRYRMLEPIRQYAQERLEESGETRAVRHRHAWFFRALAEEAEPGLTGAHQQAWADRLEREHDNLRAAISWSLENELETALRLAGALARFWEIRSHYLEGSGWLEAALRQSSRLEAATEVATRAKLLSKAGTFAFHRADFEHAIVLHGEALELYRELGDERGVGFALLCLGAQYSEQGDYEQAAPFLEEALSLSREVGDKRTIVYALHNLADVERQRGDYERAKTLGMENISLVRELEDKWLLGVCVGWVGGIAVWSGEEYDLAEEFLKEGLALDREVGNWSYGAYCLEGFAGLAGARGQGARAARLWGAAEALRSDIGAPVPPESRTYYERSMAAARARLEEGAWEAAFAEGEAMGLEEAVEYALSEGAGSTTSPEASFAADQEEASAGGQPPNLTRREKEVAALVARGLTSRQIASKLVLSAHTVDKHVANILKKLGVSSREQLAARMSEQPPRRPVSR